MPRGEIGDRDRVLDPDDALVLGGRGDRRLLALLAERQLLATEVIARTGATTGATTGTTAALLLLLREATADRVRPALRARRRTADDRRALGDLDARRQRDHGADGRARRIARPPSARWLRRSRACTAAAARSAGVADAGDHRACTGRARSSSISKRRARTGSGHRPSVPRRRHRRRRVGRLLRGLGLRAAVRRRRGGAATTRAASVLGDDCRSRSHPLLDARLARRHRRGRRPEDRRGSRGTCAATRLRARRRRFDADGRRWLGADVGRARRSAAAAIGGGLPARRVRALARGAGRASLDDRRGTAAAGRRRTTGGSATGADRDGGVVVRGPGRSRDGDRVGRA